VKTDLSTAFLTVVKLMALGLLLSVVYMIEIPAWLFFVPLLIHAVALAGLGYLFVMDNEYRGYVKNIFSIIRARAL
jgi:hypothetical protein